MRSSLAIATALLVAGAALTAVAKSDTNDRILGPKPAVPWGYQQECHYANPASQDGWFCVARPVPPHEFYRDDRHDRRDRYGPGWGGDGSWGRPAWGRRSQVLPEEQIRQQVRQSGYHRIDRIRYDSDDKVYRVRATDRRGRDVKLVYDAFTGRLVRKQTGDD
ncbi:MAG: PepSY domain-containing protein [Rhodospirillaceae bacterium]|nr:PepSY domain-containing protein [Rhodospirillaceae bacterium]